MNYNVKIYVAYNYGGWTINFENEFVLPFAPFYEMVLSYGNEYEISFVNNDNQITIINYDYMYQSFDIHIRENWKYPVSDETVDGIIKTFTDSDWTRTDTTDIKELKKLMLKDYNRINNIGTAGNRGEISTY
jgi:hypothetical protein